MIEFKIEKQSARSKARLGILETPHGHVETPAFVPVATQAVIKTLTSEETEQTGSSILIANTFHLHLKPGEQVVREAGGLHSFMNWPHPLMTDSGGFQVFSLGFGSDHGVGKVLKEKRDEVVQLGQQPRNVTITEAGVTFKSPIDGTELFLGPKESITIQQKLGADIIFTFDEATSPVADEVYTRQSLGRTHRWAEECLEHKTSDQALYGIVQGGKFPHLRQESARAVGQLPLDGFGIGGEYGDDKTIMAGIIQTVLGELPNDKPRHLLGIGHLEDIPEIIKAGIDTFDCIVPTHYARHGTAFTSEGRLDFGKRQLLHDQSPLDPACRCPVCRNHRRSYIAHLVRSKEITALRLLTFHNLYFFNQYIANLREQIRAGKL
jgi:queuine tRNA-ribosyltransferase/7-cyano-7-deazaguanine tRNA-ribosyltransferase